MAAPASDEAGADLVNSGDGRDHGAGAADSAEQTCPGEHAGPAEQTGPAAEHWPHPVGGLRALCHRVRANPTGRAALRLVVGVLGAVVVLLGLVLVPLPGPGWLIVLGGIAIWGVEFHWARRLMGFVRRQLHRWNVLMRTGPWWLRALVGLGSLVLVGILLWLSLRLLSQLDLGDLLST
ncbi:MAG: PGPGW domain-containing protein [Micromonosporaceae bacterium]|nr:PGPGW domain-containing protein [Micromonosporaceae bacterium]